YQMVGAPAWVDTERYSIRATLAQGTSPSAISILLLNLLKDRFQLATHLETREQPIFNLVTARADGRLGPNLKPTRAECLAPLEGQGRGAGRGERPAPLPGTPGGPPLPDANGPTPCGSGNTSPGRIEFSGRPLARLVPALSDLVGRPVIDKTGLNGVFDV